MQNLIMKLDIWKKTIIGIITLLVVLYIIGLTFSTRCLKYDDCESCWNIKDDKEKVNAGVDFIVCLCSKAMEKNYQDAEINDLIESNYFSITGIEASAQDICEGRVPLVKYNLTE